MNAGMPLEHEKVGRPAAEFRLLEFSGIPLVTEGHDIASLLMGQSGEGRPVVLAHGAPNARREGSVRELIRPRDRDLFR